MTERLQTGKAVMHQGARHAPSDWLQCGCLIRHLQHLPKKAAICAWTYNACAFELEAASVTDVQRCNKQTIHMAYTRTFVAVQMRSQKRTSQHGLSA